MNCHSFLHKEKERLRHQRQVKLLNKVMELVPKSARGPQTKVRKLRRLVLYSYYLKMIHSKLTKHLSPPSEDCLNCMEPEARKVVPEPVTKKSRTTRKPPKAHIVFLKADKSVKKTNCISETDKLSDKNVKTYDKSQEKTSSHPNLEYQVPDIPPSDNRISNCFSEEYTYASCNPNLTGMINHYRSYENDSRMIPKSSDQNSSRDVDSNIFSEDLYCNKLGNYESVSDNINIDCNEKEINKYSILDDDESLAPSMVYNRENLPVCIFKPEIDLRKNNDNYVLKNLDYFSVGDKDLRATPVGTSVSKEQSLYSSEMNVVQTDSSDNSYSVPENNCPSSFSYANNIFKSNAPLDSVSSEFICSPIENASDSNSTASLEKPNIDSENLSDLSSSNNSNDSGNSVQFNCYENFPNFISNNSELSQSYSIPINGYMNYKPIQTEPLYLCQSPTYTYLENATIINEASFQDIYGTPFPYYGSIYSPIMNFNRNPYNIAPFPPESFNLVHKNAIEPHTFPKVESSDPSFYDRFISAETPKPPFKQEVFTSNIPELYSQQNIQQPIFEDEVSYSLAQFIGNF